MHRATLSATNPQAETGGETGEKGHSPNHQALQIPLLSPLAAQAEGKEPPAAAAAFCTLKHSILQERSRGAKPQKLKTSCGTRNHALPLTLGLRQVFSSWLPSVFCATLCCEHAPIATHISPLASVTARKRPANRPGCLRSKQSAQAPARAVPVLARARLRTILDSHIAPT